MVNVPRRSHKRNGKNSPNISSFPFRKRGQHWTLYWQCEFNTWELFSRSGETTRKTVITGLRTNAHPKETTGKLRIAENTKAVPLKGVLQRRIFGLNINLSAGNAHKIILNFSPMPFSVNVLFWLSFFSNLHCLNRLLNLNITF